MGQARSDVRSALATPGLGKMLLAQGGAAGLKFGLRLPLPGDSMHPIFRPGPMPLLASAAFALLASPSALSAEPKKPVDPARYLTQPLVSEIYTADPSAHVWDGKIYI